MSVIALSTLPHQARQQESNSRKTFSKTGKSFILFTFVKLRIEAQQCQDASSCENHLIAKV